MSPVGSPHADRASEPLRKLNGTSDALAFFETAYAASLRAVQGSQEPVERFFDIAGAVVRLRFAGPTLPHLVLPALEHLAVAPHPDAALTVWLWDTASSGVSMPHPTWRPESVTFRGDVAGYNDQRISTAFQGDASLLSIFDAERSEAIYWLRDAQSMPFYERAAPLLRILNWWLQRRGQQVVHAAAVGTTSGGVLIAGKGGAGKSNTAIACMEGGLRYAADDYCILSPSIAPAVWSLYNSGKTHADDVSRLPFLAPLISNRENLGTEKALYFFQHGFADTLITQFPLRAILLPRVTGGRNTSMRVASPAAAVLAISPSTLSQLPGSNRQTIEIIASVCRQVPIYHLELGTDTRQIARAIASLISPA